MRSWLVPLISWSIIGLLGGCSIDQRRLEAGSGAYGGEGEASAAGESGSGWGGSGGDDGNGDSEEEGSLIGGCADLDTDGVADCEVNLLQNSTFSANVGGWVTVDDASFGWAPKNALGDLPSGSAKLSTASARVAAGQCLKVRGQQLVISYASAFLEPSGDTGDASALLEVSFFEEDDCSGERERFFETPPATARGEWVTIHAGGLSKPSTQSVSVRLVGARVELTGKLTVYFDNVLLMTRALEP